MTISPPSDPHESVAWSQRVNWLLVLGCTLIGAALIILALGLERYHEWQGVSLSAMVNIGVAFLLVALLYFVQRRLLVRVSDAAAVAASAVVDSRIEERTRGLGVRLDQLGERMDELATSRGQRQDESVANLEVPTYWTVATALAAANKLGAIAHGVVTVQGSRDYRELGLTFSYGTDDGDGRFGIPRHDTLKIEGQVYADQRARGTRYVIEAEWDAGETADVVGFRLRETLEHRGRWNSDDTLDWPAALRNLQLALDWAIRSRRRDGAPGLLRGALMELVTPDWAITDAGIECPSKEFVLGESEFPERYSMQARHQRETAPWRPEPPDWVDGDLWDELIRRGRQRLPVLKGPIAIMPTWIPITEPPSPHA